MGTDVRQELVDRIAARRASITTYLGASRPRNSRLTTISIVGSALAAVLVAGPALGGESFTGGVGGALGLNTTSVVWRLLCFLGMIASLATVITTNLQKSHDLPGRISAGRGRGCGSRGAADALDVRQDPDRGRGPPLPGICRAHPVRRRTGDLTGPTRRGERSTLSKACCCSRS
jgi:hypothetical protein